MTAEGVRASRAGDRYHYFWASRSALKLLDNETDLQFLSIEGTGGGEESTGDQVIDLGEYYGGLTFEDCHRVRYVQLKHSTVRVEKQITSSELQGTLASFAGTYREKATQGQHDKLEFEIITNRRLEGKVARSLDDLREPAVSCAHPTQAEHLRSYMGFGQDRESELDFCSRLQVTDGAPDIDEVEHALVESLNQYIPGGGTGSETADLLDLVGGLAAGQSKPNVIDRSMVLRTLRVNEYDLFPAPAKIEVPPNPIRTPDVDDVLDELRASMENKLLLTAIGGVGKSILTDMMRHDLDSIPDSVTVVFDCFAGGDYRKASSKRHLHRIALTQIANEIAGRGLCIPLLPSTDADDRAYVGAFMRKVKQAAGQIRASNPDALLTVIIDAADNAVVAANEFGERAFVADLFLEDWPTNARLVALARPERSESLQLPPHVRTMNLCGFGREETLVHLRSRFGAATVEQAMHFHELSGHNARVQAMVLELSQSVDDAIAALELVSDWPGGQLDALLAKQVSAIGQDGQMPKHLFIRLCQALATLHPAVPLEDLGQVTELSQDMIRSFAMALGRGLHVAGNTIQFRDEPTETWFRATYGMADHELREFAKSVAREAERSPYMAKELPQVYFEAGMLDELMHLAITESSLPGESTDPQRKEISRSRVAYALAAALKSQRYADASLLAVKAGEMSAGRARRLRMYRENADLTATFFAPRIVEDLCSSRDLATNWPGSNLHVEAALLSYLSGSREVARSRVYSAFSNMRAILEFEANGERKLASHVDARAVADLALATLKTDGAGAAMEFLQRWRHAEFRREAGGLLFARMCDAGLVDGLSEAILETDDQYLLLSAAEVSYEYGVWLTTEACNALVRMLLSRKKPFKRRSKSHSEVDVRGVVWALLQGLKYDQLDDGEAVRLLNAYLPPHVPDHIGENWHGVSATSVLLGFALRSRLVGTDLTVDSVVSESLAEALSQPYSRSGYASSFRSNIPELLPWAALLVELIVEGTPFDESDRMRELADSAFNKGSSYATPFVFMNGVAEIATRILAVIPDASLISRLKEWIEAGGQAHYRSRVPVIRIAGRSPELAELAVDLATLGVSLTQADRTDAENRVDELIALARAVLATSEGEARALFEAADREAELVGDDLYTRWKALTTTATLLAPSEHSQRAYRLFQIGEAIDRETELGSHELAGALHHLDPDGYCALVSRARDRRTLDFETLLSPIFTSAVTSADLSRLAVLALGPRADWQEVVGALPEASMAMVSETLSAFANADRDSGDLPEENSRWSHALSEVPSDRVSPWEYAGADFTNEETWNRALAATPWYSDQRRHLVVLACEQRKAVLADVLSALASAVQANASDFEVAATLAASGTQSLGVRKALSDLARTYSKRFARQVCAQSYNRKELGEMATAGGLPVTDLLEIAFSELGRSAHQLKYGEYFNLAARIAELLSESDKEKTFDALAKLFDDLAPADSSSDGAFSSLVSAPRDQATGLAGLLWATLGDMSIKLRWRAAHAVLLLVQLGDRSVLEQLARFSDGTLSAEAFRDQRLPEYSLHSRMWLLFALERASSEPNGASLEPFVPWLETTALEPPHAVNQRLASNSLRILNENGAVELSSTDTTALDLSLKPKTIDLDWSLLGTQPDPLVSRVDISETGGNYPFFLDFKPYWCGGLAEAFATSEEAVARVCLAIAGSQFGYDSDADDPRRTFGVFGEHTTYSSHGSWPEEEDHHFYSGIHSLLTLGAELARTATAYRDPSADIDPYTEWIHAYLTKRRDGRWLSDRRDAPPEPAPDRKLANHEFPEDWPWSIQSTDFDELVGFGQPRITVNGFSHTSLNGLVEETQVESALVPHELARSLIIAIQTSHFAGRLTTRNEFAPREHSDVDDRYRLVAWLDASGYESAIDRHDERGRDVPFPPPRPNRCLVERFALGADPDLRTWVTAHEDIEVFWCRVWDNVVSPRRGHESGTYGQTLAVNAEFLSTALGALDKSLVVRVQLRRQLRRPSYERKQTDELDYLEWSAKTYVVSPDGQWLQY